MPSPTIAVYDTNQKQLRYRGNKLIEALPPPLSDEELYRTLVYLPRFDKAAREWEDADRLRELLSLTNVMVPLTSHIQLGHALDSMMREGYVGREPMTAGHISVYHEIRSDEQAAKAGQPFRQSHTTLTPKLSQALVNVSGMGKTTTVQRVLARYPQVVYHPELDIYQITWLHFEMPSDGGGVKALLISIIEAIAELVPDNTYYEDYVLKARPSEAALQSSVRRLLNKHCVGLLIPDEVQNAANSRKSDQVVMTELTTLVNKSRTPVLYIGTPKANKVLGLDLRQSRRAMNLMLGEWGPLPRYDLCAETSEEGEGGLTRSDGEWVDLVTSLWHYSWVRNPVPLTERMLDVIYDLTQGIIDLAIKLLICAQARAIVDKSETLSEQLLHAVYQEQFKLLHPMIDAYRRKDPAALERYQDLALPDTASLIEQSAIQMRAKRGRATSVRPGSSDFVPRLAVAASALGLDEADAMSLAHRVADEGTAKDMLDAASQLVRKAAPPRAASSPKRTSKGGGQEKAPSYPGLEGQPDDFRNAIVLAFERKTPIVEQLLQLEMVPNVEDVICLA
jgi:hypothetical protein